MPRTIIRTLEHSNLVQQLLGWPTQVQLFSTKSGRVTVKVGVAWNFLHTSSVFFQHGFSPPGNSRSTTGSASNPVSLPIKLFHIIAGNFEGQGFCGFLGLKPMHKNWCPWMLKPGTLIEACTEKQTATEHENITTKKHKNLPLKNYLLYSMTCTLRYSVWFAP